MSDSLPNPDAEIVVKLSGEASLDDLIAGLEATWQGTPAPKAQAEPASAPPVEEPPPPSAPAQRIERRGAERREPHEFKAELRLAVAGFPMRLVNLSATGLLAETNQRLCPGRTVDVFLRYGGVRKVLRATVIRSSMHAVAPNPVFRAALQFEDTAGHPSLAGRRPMSLMPSLCAALERAGGDRLVMRAGERPHVLAGERRHDVASAVLSVSAVEALAEQILSSAARHELAANGSVSEPVTSTSFPRPLSARAERVGDDFCIELMVSMAQVEAPEPVEEVASPVPPEPEVSHSAPNSYYAAPISEATPEQTVHDEPAPTNAADPAPVEQPEVIAVTEPAPVGYEPEPVAPYVPEPVASNVPEPVPVPPPPPAPEIAVESPREVRPEPVRHQEVTVVTRVEKPVRAPRPVANVTAALDLFEWIGHAADLGATTLYLRAGSPAAARIDERIQPISQETVAASVIEDTTAAFTRGGDGVWEARADGEWVREDELGYISCRVFSDQQGSGLIFHLRPSTSLRLLHKHIPRQVRTACEGNGLVVVAASNEADVEALAAAVADWSGRDRGGYLISLQRRSRSHGEIAGAFVSQRTIAGTDKDFAAAIRRAAQESPDILLVTGLQAEQPLQAAVLAAAGGRLVIAGVVAPTTVEALRMLAGSDSHVRRAMAASFRAAIGYRSLRRLGGGRTLIQDVVLASGSVCSLIESGDFSEFARTQNDVAAKMKSVDEALARAVTRRQISLREAASQAIDRSHLVALVRSQARTTSSGTLALAGGRDVRPADTQTADHRMASGFSRY